MSRSVSMLRLCVLLLLWPAFSREFHEEAKGALKIETLSWHRKKLQKSVQVLPEDDEDEQHSFRNEVDHGEERRLTERLQRLEALWDRPSYRMRRFNLTVDAGEHPCFAGFKSMIRDTDRCQGWQRSYVSKGQKQMFQNTGVSRWSNFTLQDVVGGYVNVWLEDGSSDVHNDVAVKAAEIYTNSLGAEELKPTKDTASWMEQECKVMGQMPFMYSCSNKINVLVQKCGFDNAFVMSSDYLVNYPAPVNNKSRPNNDIIFYLCHELVDGNPNPYAVANTFAHELAHVIQGGFGSSSGVMMEGGATWLEGNLLKLAPRPMVYAWGFRDWNRINAAHIYAQTKRTNARKFYQIHAMLLTYLSQDALLGDQGSSALQNYETFSQDLAPFGQRTYDYFLQFVGKDRPRDFSPHVLEVTSVEHPFGEVLLNFRLALASQCINEAKKRPSDVKYLMPEQLRDRPFWDCTSFPTFSPEAGSASHEGLDLHYGGAGIYRLASARDATVRIDAKADWQLRTKVLAAGDGIQPAEVRELRPGEAATFSGEREIFVVQVNVDPEGETLSRADKGNVWHQDDCQKLEPGCSGKAWTVAKNGFYPNNAAEGLRSPMITLPEARNLTMNFKAWWRLEAVEGGFMSKTENGCSIDGWDGVQVRLHVYSDPSADEHANGIEVVVLEPEGGYDNRTKDAIAAFGNVGIRAPYSQSYVKDCKSMDGWTGSSPSGFTLQNFSLEKYAGKHARIEVVFASDSGTVMSGFWLKDLEVKGDGKVLFNRTEDLYGSAFVYSIQAGTTGSAGVPVVVQYPDGYEADVALQKRSVTRKAAWSASWTPGPLRQTYLGWSYESPVVDTKTLKLRPQQEACLQLKAPFRGVPKVATLFTLVDKVGIRSVTLQGRTSDARPLGNAMTSPSEGVTDPGVHRFHIKEWPVLEAGERFFFCVSTGDVEHLLTDTSASQPFLHLPLTNVAATTRDEAGWMVLREDGKEIPADELQNLWLEHRITLRVEFQEVQSRRLRGTSPNQFI